MTSGIEQSTLFTILWWSVATMVVISAFLVVHLTDLLKAALALITSFLGIAGLFVMLNAEFLAVIQVLIYAGAIPILIIFAILMLQDVQRGSPSNRLRLPAFVLASCFLVILVIALGDARGTWSLIADSSISTSGQTEVAVILSNTTPVLGNLLLNNFALPLEAAAVLLLAAVLGALALVREQ
jgi:NADH:ubiquinone oxidoreductase subunit 6 (subunit J)